MSRRRSIAGRIFVLIALIGLTAVVASRFTDFQKFIDMLRHGSGTWITAGLLIHVGYFIAYAHLYRRGFDVVDVPSKTMSLVPVVFAGIFVNAVIPSGGAGAAALFIDDARRRGESGARAAVGVVLVLLTDLFTLLPFIAWGFAFLAMHHKVAGYDAISGAIFVAYVFVLVLFLSVAYRSERRLTQFLEWVRRLVNRFKAGLISEAWPARTSNEFCHAAHMLVQRPGKLIILAGWGVIVHIINVTGLWALTRAFDVALPISGIIAGFGIGIIFFIASPVPQGVAVVEAVMTLVFTSLGMPEQKAITVALIFRGVNFWLPLVIGIWFLWRLRRFGERAVLEPA